MGKIMDCENCPAVYSAPSYSYDESLYYHHCGISGDEIDDGIPESDCPVRRIELRDGTIFEPKVKED